MPTLNAPNMPYDRSSADRVRTTFSSCGTNENVVSVAATSPRVVNRSMVVSRRRALPLAHVGARGRRLRSCGRAFQEAHRLVAETPLLHDREPARAQLVREARRVAVLGV